MQEIPSPLSRPRVPAPLIALFRYGTACLLALLHTAWSPLPVQAHEVVILKSANIAPYNQAISSFKSSMPRETTFIEYDLKGDAEAGRKYAAKIRASGADLVLAVGSKAAIAARLELFDIPIIHSMVMHPAKYDLKAPNIAGVASTLPIGQQLTHLRAVLPNLKRIGYLYDPDKTPRDHIYRPAGTNRGASPYGLAGTPLRSGRALADRRQHGLDRRVLLLSVVRRI
jgi:ABC-type uncharacterized transport system substrate-binding protein